ncbi:DinB family protein [Kribbella sp. NPDC055110]
MNDIVIEKIVRPARVLAGSWQDVIASNLDYHRATFLWKCEGLSDAQLRLRAAPASELSLLSLMRHLQGVERYWLQHKLAGTSPRFFPYRMRITADGEEWFDESDPTPAKDVYADYLAACQDSRELFAKGTEDVARIEANPEYGDTDVRFVLTHVIEEYARHVGHADLLRECIDGATGE